MIYAIAAILGLLIAIATVANRGATASAPLRSPARKNASTNLSAPAQDFGYREMLATDAQKNHIEALGGRFGAALENVGGAAAVVGNGYLQLPVGRTYSFGLSHQGVDGQQHGCQCQQFFLHGYVMFCIQHAKIYNFGQKSVK